MKCAIASTRFFEYRQKYRLVQINANCVFTSIELQYLTAQMETVYFDWFDFLAWDFLPWSAIPFSFFVEINSINNFRKCYSLFEIDILFDDIVFFDDFLTWMDVYLDIRKKNWPKFCIARKKLCVYKRHRLDT